MAVNPLEQQGDKGFWDGGAPGHGTNKESSGRPSGLPGKRTAKRIGVKSDLDAPPSSAENDDPEQ